MTTHDSSSASRHWLLVPATLRKRGQALLHRQCWVWGQDIKRPEGNAMVQLGFQRSRPPQGVVGSSTYTLQIDDSRQVHLWGFGLCYCDACRGGIFLGRFLFAPRFSRYAALPECVWSSQQLQTFRIPPSVKSCETTIELMSELLEWIGDYEAQVMDEMGWEYRANTLKKWSHHAIDPLVAPAAWRGLSTQCRQKIRVMARDENGVREVLRTGLEMAS